jgi:hypothetical protein
MDAKQSARHLEARLELIRQSFMASRREQKLTPQAGRSGRRRTQGGPGRGSGIGGQGGREVIEVEAEVIEPDDE